MINVFPLILLLLIIITGIAWLFENIINTKNSYKNNIIKKNKFIFLSSIHNRFRLLEFISSFFPIITIVFIFRSFIYEPFKIPSDSMVPTLIAGDFILVNKHAYNIQEPITQKIIINISYPKRNDIVVFKYPIDKRINFIKRIIGIPGDLILYDSIKKELKIYPLCNKINECNKKINISYINLDKNKYLNNIQFEIVKENIENKSHNLLLLNEKNNSKLSYKQIKQHISIWKVPKDNYFVMGDSRDNSLDSRYWGFVPIKNIIGKAVFIFFNIDKNVNSLINSINFNRIGKLY